MRHRLHLRILRNVGATVTGRASLSFDVSQRVFHDCWRPSYKTILVATIALIGNRNVCSRFGLRIGKNIVATVTPGTLGRRIGVIHLDRLESREIGVAGVALTGRRNMVGRLAEDLLA